ncbi:hypothetical protein HYH03_012854 [Edaphochlamys debaryana]|nr:hypothetical protein HYH03_012854 [Edaphochlamys debaryana]|eukprot:KAG2488535.1 hypothetical protein HYH03_012854 [Edaphochlamys debaryana]
MDWTMNEASFPINITCLATSGCIISNAYPRAAAMAASQLPPDSETCIHLQARESVSLHLMWSNDPDDGLSVLFDPATTLPDYPPRSGVSVFSQANCNPNGASCASGVLVMVLPVGPGLSLASYVRTHNWTQPEGNQGRFRQEWFMSRVGEDGALSQVELASRPCFNQLPPATLASLQQARIRLQPFWNKIEVTKDGVWLSLWGTCGGALSTFLQVGMALVVVLNFFTNSYYNRRNGNGGGNGNSNDGAHSKVDGHGDGDGSSGTASPSKGPAADQGQGHSGPGPGPRSRASVTEPSSMAAITATAWDRAKGRSANGRGESMAHRPSFKSPSVHPTLSSPGGDSAAGGGAAPRWPLAASLRAPTGDPGGRQGPPSPGPALGSGLQPIRTAVPNSAFVTEDFQPPSSSPGNSRPSSRPASRGSSAGVGASGKLRGGWASPPISGSGGAVMGDAETPRGSRLAAVSPANTNA